VISDPTR